MPTVQRGLLFLLPIAGLIVACSTAAQGQNQPPPNEQILRRTFVAECLGPKTDTATLSFCNCSFTKLVSRYGLNSFAQQDSIIRASNAKDLVMLARLAWQPEFSSCRAT